MKILINVKIFFFRLFFNFLFYFNFLKIKLTMKNKVLFEINWSRVFDVFLSFIIVFISGVNFMKIVPRNWFERWNYWIDLDAYIKNPNFFMGFYDIEASYFDYFFFFGLFFLFWFIFYILIKRSRLYMYTCIKKYIKNTLSTFRIFNVIFILFSLLSCIIVYCFNWYLFFNWYPKMWLALLLILCPIWFIVQVIFKYIRIFLQINIRKSSIILTFILFNIILIFYYLFYLIIYSIFFIFKKYRFFSYYFNNINTAFFYYKKKSIYFLFW